MNRSRPIVLIFKMRDRCLVANLRVELNRALFPFQIGAGANAEQDRQRESKDWSFHFFE
jgi:hypothetical protein